MSVRVISEVWERTPDVSGTALLVALALADYANDEGVSYPYEETLATKARCDVSTVRRAICALRERGHLDVWKWVDGRGGRRRNCYRLTVGYLEALRGVEPDELAERARAMKLDNDAEAVVEQPREMSGSPEATTAQIERSQPGEMSGLRARGVLSSEPSSRTEGPPVSPPTTSKALAVPDEPNRPAKVNGKDVLDAEYQLAVDVLAAFNAVAGTRFVAKGYIAKVVMRIREHPELDAVAHRAVIEAAFRHPWWKGAPDPRVVYGNDAQFESCIHQTAADLHGRDDSGGMTAEEMETYGTVWGPGTPYPSLAAARVAATLGQGS